MLALVLVWDGHTPIGDVAIPGGILLGVVSAKALPGSISALLVACLLRRYSRAGNQNDRLGESFSTVCSAHPPYVFTHMHARAYTRAPREQVYPNQ